MEYRTGLYATIGATQYLLKGLAFYGHDESYKSRNHCIPLDVLEIISNNSDDIKSVVLNNALGITN